MLTPGSTSSSTCISTVEFTTTISVGILVTVTVIFLLSAAEYFSLPKNLTVTVALPVPTPINAPLPSTRTTLTSLET